MKMNIGMWWMVIVTVLFQPLVSNCVSLFRNLTQGKPGRHVVKRQIRRTCSNGYETVVNSTMCARDSSLYIRESSGISDADIRRIVDFHNTKRAGVYPKAANMMKMYWNEELSRVAEKWAKQCVVGHDKSLNMSRYIPRYGVMPGQNAAFGFGSWEGALSGWYEEQQKYKYGENPEVYLGEKAVEQIGHFTQMTTADSILIGCGFARCQFHKYETFYICNYVTAQYNIINPYKSGPSCQDCPNSCRHGLCDCGNKYCFNGGTLDINTCGCSCTAPWFGPQCLETPCPGVSCKNGGHINTSTCRCDCEYPYSGHSCEILKCEKRSDPAYCGNQWPEDHCTKYSNVKRECAVMCGVCEAPCNGKKCQNGGKLDTETCSCHCGQLYSGNACQIKNCPRSDPSHCGTQWPKTFCAKYSNVPTSCPIMCGLCKDPCNGLKCQNGGTLNPNTCSCSCSSQYRGSYCQIEKCPGMRCKNGGTLDVQKCQCSCTPLFIGRVCSTKNCPKFDPEYCGTQWPMEYCTAFSNVPTACPIMCGLCSAPCGKKKCMNKGKLNPDTCTCECSPGYEGNTCERERCPGVQCDNGGQLDYKRCSCSCKRPFTGFRCQTKNCPKTDPFYCGTQWPTSYCTKYSNVPSECPIMCGLCKASCGSKLCENGGKLNTETCTCSCSDLYLGDSCQIKHCQKSDPYYCGSEWPTSHCTQYSNVPDACPVMCGLCQAPCSGKMCRNGGTLDTDSCKCNCPSGYTGDDCRNELCPGVLCKNGGTINFKTCQCSCEKLFSGKLCETKKCPASDPFYCGTDWTKDYCKKYSNVPSACPFMCGLC